MKNADVKRNIAAKLERMDGQGVASAEQVMQFLTDVMRGRVKDQFGLDAALSDRLVAARELLRRLDVVDGRQGTLERLDGLLLEFRMAIYGGDDPDDENDDMPTD